LILRAGRIRRKKSEVEKNGKNHPTHASHKDTSLAKRSKGGDAPIAHLPWPEFRGTTVMALRVKEARAGCLSRWLLRVRVEFSHKGIDL
jgi:hypothetical protein